MLEKISTFSPESASSQIKAHITEIASKFKKSVCTNINCTIREWNLLHTAQVKNCTRTGRNGVPVCLCDASEARMYAGRAAREKVGVE